MNFWVISHITANLLKLPLFYVKLRRIFTLNNGYFSKLREITAVSGVTLL